MNDREKEILRGVLEEMENAHGIITFWLKGTPIEKTLGSWIETLSLLHDGTYDAEQGGRKDELTTVKRGGRG